MRKQLVTCALTVLLLGAEPPAEVKRDRHGDPLPPGAVGRLGTTRFRDDTTMIFAAVSADRKLYATSTERRLVIWDAVTGRPIQTGMPVEPWVVRASLPEYFQCVDFSPDGKALAHSVINVEPPELRLYDVGTKKLRRTITGLAGIVERVSFSPDGTLLFGIQSRRVLGIWDARSGEPVKKLTDLPPRVVDFVLSPDGKHVAVQAGEESKPLVWESHDLSTGKLVRRFDQEQGYIGNIAWLVP
jgi:WD40 repeat protein